MDEYGVTGILSTVIVGYQNYSTLIWRVREDELIGWDTFSCCILYFLRLFADRLGFLVYYCTGVSVSIPG